MPSEAEAGSPGLFQQVRFDYTGLGKGGTSGLGMQDCAVSSTIGLPLQPGLPQLLITPGAAFHAWQRSAVNAATQTPDLPATLYDLSVDVGWRPRLAEWLFADLGVTPGLYSDFREVNESSFRLRGRALGIVAFSPQWQLVGGVLYVNRNNVKLLPSGGVLWNPSEDTRCQLVFPAPKVAHRFLTTGPTAWWGYLAGEFGGGSWSVERANGAPDSVDYKDVRVLAGMEWDTAQSWKGHVEVGYIFGRNVDYVSPTPDYKPGDTVLLRAGFRY